MQAIILLDASPHCSILQVRHAGCDRSIAAVLQVIAVAVSPSLGHKAKLKIETFAKRLQHKLEHLSAVCKRIDRLVCKVTAQQARNNGDITIDEASITCQIKHSAAAAATKAPSRCNAINVQGTKRMHCIYSHDTEACCHNTEYTRDLMLMTR
eukprot:18536-Heterococcus_DN1.PRE.8